MMSDHTFTTHIYTNEVWWINGEKKNMNEGISFSSIVGHFDMFVKSAGRNIET